MNEVRSRLRVGAADEPEPERVCRACADAEAMRTWVSYHVIGDVLRGSGIPAAGFSPRR